MTPITWGNPYRGLCSGGSISLPGGGTRACAQPWGDTDDDYGQTLLQRGPGAYIERTVEEAERDIQLGYTWRTDALLSGVEFELYGRPLGGFIYCAADGSRWRITALWSDIQAHQPLDIVLTASRFGEWDGAADERTLTASLADIGQADPDPALPVSDIVSVAVCDLQPDGSRALLMLYVPYATIEAWGYGHRNICKRPLGWLELTISGDASGLSASLAVVRTRGQALGTGVVRQSNWSGSGELTLAGLTSTSVDMGTYNEVTYTYAAGLGETHGYGRLNADNEISISNRIVALWYTATGFEEVTLDYRWTESGGNAVPLETTSGQRIEHHSKDGGAVTVIEDTLQHEVSRTGQLDGALTVSLHRADLLIDQVTGSASNAMDLQRVLRSPSGTSQSRTETGSGVLDGSAGSITEPMAFDANTPFFTTVDTSRLAPLLPGSTSNMPRIQALASGYSAEMYMTDWYRADTNVRRYSNNLLAPVVASGPYDFDAGVYRTTTRTGPAAYPGGQADTGLATGANTRWYGSYNPATGEIIRDQSSPACWI